MDALSILSIIGTLILNILSGIIASAIWNAIKINRKNG